MAVEELEQAPAQDEMQDVAPDNDQAAQSAEDTATSETADSAADTGKGIQKRIDELTRNWRSTERERDHWREVAQQALQGPKTAEPDMPSGPPKSDDYESYEDYIDALTDYKVDQRARQIQEQTATRQAETAKQEIQRQFQGRVTQFSTDHPDFWDVAGNPSVPITQTVVDVAMESDIGPDVLYHLGKNPGEAAKLAQLSPTAVAREIGKLEARLQLPAKTQVSQAPDPIKPIGGGGEKSAKDPEKMDMDEFMTWRRQSLKR